MTTAEKLVAKLRDLLGVEAVPEGAVAVRLNPSRAARDAGAWSWALDARDGHSLDIGSMFPMSAIVRCPEPLVSKGSDIGGGYGVSIAFEIDPCREHGRSA